MPTNLNNENFLVLVLSNYNLPLSKLMNTTLLLTDTYIITAMDKLSCDVKDILFVTNVPENGPILFRCCLRSDNWLRRHARLSSSLPTPAGTLRHSDPLQ